MKLNDKLMLGFQENQSSLRVMLRNYQFMYACTYLAENMGGEDRCAGRMQAIIRTNL